MSCVLSYKSMLPAAPALLPAVFFPDAPRAPAPDDGLPPPPDSAIRALLYDLLASADDRLPPILESLLGCPSFASVEPAHVEKLALCLGKPRLCGPALALLARIFERFPPAVSALAQGPLLAALRPHICGDTPFAAGAFALLRSAFSSPAVARDALFGSECFGALAEQIDADRGAAGAALLPLMASVPGFPPGFAARLFPLCASLYNSGSDDAARLGLECLSALDANGGGLESFALDSAVVEDLTAFVARPPLRAAALRALAALCRYGDPLLAVMRRSGTVYEVRSLIGGRDAAAAHGALAFFRQWLAATRDKDYLYDQITQVDFVAACAECQFEAKCEMARLVAEICEGAAPLHVARLVTPAFVETVVDVAGCLGEELGERLAAAIAAACAKCQALPGFVAMVADALGAVATDVEAVGRLIDEVHGMIGR
jgi:hypothetical protein